MPGAMISAVKSVKPRVAVRSLWAVAVVAIVVHALPGPLWQSAVSKRVHAAAIQLPWEPQEFLWGAAAGNLTGNIDPALVFGTVLPGDRGRVRVLHQRGGVFREVWSYTHDASFHSVIIRDVDSVQPEELITLWTRGQGAYLDVRVFQWTGQTYREIWNLDQYGRGRQLTQGAHLLIQRVDLFGIQLVVRAPNVAPGASTLGALPHQVSIYRWDNQKRSLVLFRRFVDTQKTFE